MHAIDHLLFDSIADELYQRGYSIHANAINIDLANNLYAHISDKTTQELKSAGVGRHDQHTLNKKIRGDHIEWIDGSTAIGLCWLAWVETLRLHLNRRLFLGLEFFESHYAYYPQGAFYLRHKDAFVGDSNRVLSMVVYLNPNWQDGDGGELMLFQSEDDTLGTKVLPCHGTLVLFLSEEFPHEVMPALNDRYSIAGWFRQKPTDLKVF